MNTISIVGVQGTRSGVACTCSKRALVGLAKHIAVAYLGRESGVSVAHSDISVGGPISISGHSEAAARREGLRPFRFITNLAQTNRIPTSFANARYYPQAAGSLLPTALSPRHVCQENTG